MTTPDAYVKAASALVLAAFGAAVLVARPQRRVALALGAFLCLLAVNQGAETLRALAATPHEATRWFRVASVAAALDPLALYVFASLYPEANALGRARRLAIVAGGSALLALWAGWGLSDKWALHLVGNSAPQTTSFDFFLSAFTAAVYGTVLLHALYRTSAAATGRASAAFLVAAALAAIPPWATAGQAVRFFPLASRFEAASGHHLNAALGLGGLAIALGIVSRLRVPGGARRPFRVGVALATAIVVATVAESVVVIAGPLATAPPLLVFLGRAAGSLRLLAVALLLSVAVLRDDALAIDVPSRRRAARVLVASGALAALAIPLVALTGGQAEIVPGLDVAEAILLLVVLAATQSARGLIDRAALVAYGVPLPGDPVGRQEAYRRAVEQALAQGRLPSRDPALARLRADLEIEDRVAALTERLAAEASGHLVSEGRVFANRYRVGPLIGRGSGGRVFRAEDLLLGRDVVLKEARDTAAGALREARIAGSLGHPNVVAVLDVVDTSDGRVIVQEHVAGGSLADRLAARGPLDAEDGARLLDGVLEGLAEMHRRHLVHRDLKPANVLLAADGTPKIADFGLARGLGEDETRVPGALVGTPAFAAPEQRRGDVETPATDVYLAGRLAVAAIASPLPPRLAEVVARATADEPAKRYPDAAAMLAALRGHDQ